MSAIRTSHFRNGLAGIGGLVVIAASLAPASMSMSLRAWLMTGGFAAVTIAMLAPPRRGLTPLILALIMTLFGGLSAVVAVPEPPEKAAERASTMTKEQIRASRPAEGYVTTVTPQTFRYAATITGLGGLAAIGGAFLLAGGGAPRRRRERSPARLERAGKSLVLIGFLGAGAALIRFAVTQLPVEDVWESAKSFWVGGTYLLLVATFAVPGFGLWAQGLFGRRASLREFMLPAALAALYLCLLVPTGQRGFVIALGVIGLAILVGNRFISMIQLVAISAAAVFLIGLTQAARNEATATGSISAEGFVERIAPSGWKDLYASQIASFNWTVLIAANRDGLDMPNSFVNLLAKPVPRSIYPEKSQGFGSEFTERVYPAAADQQISFATPIFAEADYSFGPVGTIFLLGLLGALCALAERRFARRAPPAVAPIVLVTIGWSAFLLVRGDLANAVVFSSAWIAPLIIFSRALGLRDDPPIRRLVVDALQVAPEFSGIGRRLAEIGRGLKGADLGLAIEVRCCRDAVDQLRPHFPEDAEFLTPLASSRPRARRILYQQLVMPFRDRADSILLSPGDQAPLWGVSPLIFVIHDVRRLTRPETASSGLEQRYYRLVMRSGARRARSIVTISEFSRSEIRRVLNPACEVSIVSQQPDGAVRSASDSDGECLILCVGAIRRYKGLDTVIEALALTRRAEAPVRVVHVGASESDDGVAEALRADAERVGVADRFELLGWLPDEELSRLRRRATATISPSRYEGYGLTVAESLAAGLPTLASDIPPHREIAGDAALYFSPTDAAALSDLMIRLARDGELRSRLASLAADRHRELAAGDRSWAVALREAVEATAGPSRVA